MKTSELTGEALDWAVSQATGVEAKIGSSGTLYCIAGDIPNVYSPTQYWAQGGPLIESNDLNVTRRTHSEVTESGQDIYRKDGWTACTTSTAYWITPTRTYGPTALVAAMRCLVASRLGDEVELPKELT